MNLIHLSFQKISKGNIFLTHELDDETEKGP